MHMKRITASPSCQVWQPRQTIFALKLFPTDPKQSCRFAEDHLAAALLNLHVRYYLVGPSCVEGGWAARHVGLL